VIEYVFPQDVRDETTGTKVRREGGLTKLELAMILLTPSVLEKMDLIVPPSKDVDWNLQKMTRAMDILEAIASMVLISAEKAQTRENQ
jgi:hypothetical protein